MIELPASIRASSPITVCLIKETGFVTVAVRQNLADFDGSCLRTEVPCFACLREAALACQTTCSASRSARAGHAGVGDEPMMKDYIDRMEERDRNDLRTAVSLLERPGLSIRLINLLGYPIERFIKALPRWIERMLGNTATKAVGTAFYVALSTMDKRSRGRPFRLIHRAMVLASGAVGGFFGLPGLIVELPISTTLMLRSIADIARSEGEDLSSMDTHLACITVFALGGRSKGDNAAETAYYAVRAALARTLSEAAELIAQRGIAEEGTPIVIRVMANLASRFGVIVTDKMAAEMVPILGAFGGASINYLFISHFQAAARGHFIVRRLERKYGGEFVKKEYEKALGELRDGVKQ